MKVENALPSRQWFTGWRLLNRGDEEESGDGNESAPPFCENGTSRQQQVFHLPGGIDKNRCLVMVHRIHCCRVIPADDGYVEGRLLSVISDVRRTGSGQR